MHLYFIIYTIVSLNCILSANSWHLRNKQISPIIFGNYFFILNNIIIICILNILKINIISLKVPGDGGSQIEAKLNKTKVVHYLCEKVSTEYFNIWLNLELLVPVIIDCWVIFLFYVFIFYIFYIYIYIIFYIFHDIRI